MRVECSPLKDATLLQHLNSPLEDATLLQHLDAIGVGGECAQEQEVVLAERVQQPVALETAVRLQPRRGREPLNHILHQLLQIALAILWGPET